MKKLDRLILRSFLGPLVLTFTISVFVLLMQFLWKYIDDLVGKGLEFNVIAELLLYASATFVPMALPIAVLFASIMTMGNFGEKYELVAMKAGGISIRRVMMPMLLVVTLLTGVAFFFANNVMPSAMLHYRMTLYDITRKKPAVNIRPGEYYKEIEGYVIRVGAKAPDGCTLEDVIIYDHSKGTSENNVIVARKGVMQSTIDNRYLLFTLTDGYSYTEPTTGKNYRRRPLTTVRFDRQTIAFDISSFAFNRSGEDLFKGSYQMMNIAQLNEAVVRLDSNLQSRFTEYGDVVDGSLRAWASYCGRPLKQHKTNEIAIQPMGVESTPVAEKKQDINSSLPFRKTRNAMKEAEKELAVQSNDMKEEATETVDTVAIAEVNPNATLASLLESLDESTLRRVKNRARSTAATSATDARNYADMTRGDREYINRHKIEKQRKFTLSIACLLMFLIGAPFGSIVRKGGLGMPLVASVAFFVVYYVVGMIAEKAVRESVLGPEGMWVSSIVMLPIGIVLTLQATTDSAFFDAMTWKKKFKRLTGKKI